MKSIWVKISYFWFVLMLLIVGLLTDNLRVNASTANPTYTKYRVQYYSLSTGTSAWSSVEEIGTRTALSSGYGVSAISTRFGWSSKFQSGTKYRVVVEMGVSPNTYANEFSNVDTFTCFGSTSTSNWSADNSLIGECSMVGSIFSSNDKHIKYIFDITPLSTIIGIQFNIYFATTQEISAVNVYTTSNISYGEDVSGSIDNQTIIIQEEFNDLTNIINNNNQSLIDAITENNTNCDTITISKNTSKITAGSLASACTRSASSSAYITDYIRVNELSTINVLRSSSYCFYDNSKTPISSKSTYTSGTLNMPQNVAYVRVQFSQSGTYEYANIKTCMSNTQSTNDKLEDINDTISSDEVDSPDSSLEEMQDMLPTNGTITQLIALPLSLYQKVLNSINGTCQSFNLGSLYGTNLIMPCIDLNNYLGNTLWNTIDLIISGIFVLTIGRKMIKAFEGFTSMKEGDVIND